MAAFQDDDQLGRPVPWNDGTPLAVALPLAEVRRDPNEGAERVTQALLNAPVAVSERQDEWAYVRLLDYEGWMLVAALASAPRPSGQVAVVQEPRAILTLEDRSAPTDLTVFASTVLPIIELGDRTGAVRVTLPGRRQGSLANADIAVQAAAAPFPPLDAAAAVAFAQRLLGAPYLWGGITIDGADCSGFVQLCWRLAGYTLPRDSYQQFDAVPYLVARGELAPGDLLFFGGSGAVTHVAISLGGDRYIHAKGEPQSSVIISSLDPSSPEYLSDVAARYLGARRVAVGGGVRTGERR